MAKLKVLLHSLWYPIAIASYYRNALEARGDIDLKVVGVFTGTWIPWKGGMNLPQKYAKTPDVPLPHHFSSPIADYEYVKHQLQGWKPDLIITVDAGSRWTGKPSEGYVAHVGTDGHCLDYDKPRLDSDKFFNMHERYAKSGDVILPYAYDHTVHYRGTPIEKEYDVVMVGVEYQHRIELVARLRAEGIRTYFSNGEVFEEYREVHQRAHIGVNWSSLDDLNARAFELPMMGNIPVMNRVTDMSLPRHHYFDYAYLFGCDNEASNKTQFVQGAIDKVKYVMANLEQCKTQLEDMRELIKGETYSARVQTILDECGFGGSVG